MLSRCSFAPRPATGMQASLSLPLFLRRPRARQDSSSECSQSTPSGRAQGEADRVREVRAEPFELVPSFIASYVLQPGFLLT
eukprot:5980787-Pleurochrysis_carterae.AAC.2